MDQRPIYNNAFTGGSGALAPRRQAGQRGDDEIDLMEILSLLMHHIWLFALTAVIGALLVGIGVKLFVPAKYTARATIYVFSTAGETSTANLNQANQMSKDFQIIATTRPTMDLVAEELGEGMTAGRIVTENKIQVTSPTDSHMLRISVTNSDPVMAAKVSNALANVMCEQIAYIMKSERPQFVEPAVMGSKTSPYVKRDALIGGIGFALVAMIFVLVRYFVNDTITTEDDVNRYLGLTILSSVPYSRNMSKRT